MARSGVVGMLVLGSAGGTPQGALPAHRGRLLSILANRAALALENHLYQRELISSERMAALGAMAGMLAHDFRNPMTVVRGHAEMLLEDGLRLETVRSQAELIVRMVDRLDRMTGRDPRLRPRRRTRGPAPPGLAPVLRGAGGRPREGAARRLDRARARSARGGGGRPGRGQDPPRHREPHLERAGT
jgi:signal transduction histidine kinase